MYQAPYDEYEDGSTMICCPICGNPSDYCLDHNHWNCDLCNEPLQINQNVEPVVWECCNGCSDELFEGIENNDRR